MLEMLFLVCEIELVGKRLMTVLLASSLGNEDPRCGEGGGRRGEGRRTQIKIS